MRRAECSIPCFAITLALSGCGLQPVKTAEPVTTVRMIQTTSYPELPDIPLPAEPVLLPWEYELPRDLSRMEPKSPECSKATEKERNENNYWDTCGEHPVIRETNVLFGFDQRNWNIMLSNFSKLREYIFQLKARVDLANESRREWRQRAQDERRRTEAASAAAVAKPASAPQN